MVSHEIQFVQIRQFDAEPLIALYQEAGWWTESPKARADIPALIRGSFCFIAAMDGAQLIGMGRVISDGVSDAYIHDVFVTDSHRQRGIGREIVRQLTAFCLKEGLEWVGLSAEPGTVSFYEALGFDRLENYQTMRLNIQRFSRS